MIYYALLTRYVVILNHLYANLSHTWLTHIHFNSNIDASIDLVNNLNLNGEAGYLNLISTRQINSFHFLFLFFAKGDHFNFGHN